MSASSIKRILNQVHPDISIRKNALEQLVRVSDALGFSVVNVMTKYDIEEIEKAITAIIGGELAKHAKSEGKKTVALFEKENKTDLTFSVKYVVKTMLPNAPIEVAVYLASTLEYICAEILDLAGNRSRDLKRKMITAFHINLTIRNDDELNGMMERNNIRTTFMLDKRDIKTYLPIMEDEKNDGRNPHFKNVASHQTSNPEYTRIYRVRIIQWIEDYLKKKYDAMDPSIILIHRFAEWYLIDFLIKCSSIMKYRKIDMLTTEEIICVAELFNVDRHEDDPPKRHIMDRNDILLFATMVGIKETAIEVDKDLNAIFTNTITAILNDLDDKPKIQDVILAIDVNYGVSFY